MKKQGQIFNCILECHLSSGCHTNTQAVSTPRVKMKEKLVLDGNRSPILQKDDATRYSSASMRLSWLAQDRLDLAESERASLIRLCPVEAWSAVSGRKPKAGMRFRRQKHVDKISVFVDSDFTGDPVSRRSTTGLVAQSGNHTVKSGSTAPELDSVERWRGKQYTSHVTFPRS